MSKVTDRPLMNGAQENNLVGENEGIIRFKTIQRELTTVSYVKYTIGFDNLMYVYIDKIKNNTLLRSKVFSAFP